MSAPEQIERYMGPISSSLRPEADGCWVRYEDFENNESERLTFKQAYEDGLAALQAERERREEAERKAVDEKFLRETEGRRERLEREHARDATEQAEEKFKRTDERYVNARAEHLEAVHRAEQAEQKLGAERERVGAAEMLAEFHRVFAHPTTDALWLRPTLHREEHRELIDALEDAERLTAVGALDEALPQVARELADVVYVAYGTALLYGIDLDTALREVHRANLSKVGDDGQPERREDGKVLKGPNFQPPDMSAALTPSDTQQGETCKRCGGSREMPLPSLGAPRTQRCPYCTEQGENGG